MLFLSGGFETTTGRNRVGRTHRDGNIWTPETATSNLLGRARFYDTWTAWIAANVVHEPSSGYTGKGGELCGAKWLLGFTSVARSDS